MGRPVFPHELIDPDFTWLITNYKENHPNSVSVEDTCLPVVFITEDEETETGLALIESPNCEGSSGCGAKERV